MANTGYTVIAKDNGYVVTHTMPDNMDDNALDAQTKTQDLLSMLAGRPIVLIGMMGAGKTTVGRRLSTKLGRKFLDSDTEIEAAAGMTIPEMFSTHGQPEFRAGETRVIARILKQQDIVLGTGGGAFMEETTRQLIKKTAVSVWLDADFDLLFSRVSRRSNRPLLQTPNPRETLRQLVEARSPTYANADITVMSTDVPHESVAAQIVDQLHAYLSADVPTPNTSPEGQNETPNDQN
jgi:shikimate kinase